MPSEKEFDKSEEQDADFGNTPIEDDVDEIHDLYDWVMNGCRFAATFTVLKMFPDISEEDFEAKVGQDVETLLSTISKEAFGLTPRQEETLSANEMASVMKAFITATQSYMSSGKIQ